MSEPIAGRRLQASLTPEEAELQAKRTELDRVEIELAERELELATLRAELSTIHHIYARRVGPLYARLDELRARIAEAVAEQNPADDLAQRNAEHTRKQAEASAADADAAEQTPRISFEASAELKQLYREAARKFHPDHATDETEINRRRAVMAEINSAYNDCDEQKLRQILTDWQTSPDEIKGEDLASQLVRVIRQIAQVRRRIEAVEREIAELKATDAFQLKGKCEEQTSNEETPIDDLARQIQQEIDQTECVLQRILARSQTQ